MSHYASGHAFEHRVKARLVADGYEVFKPGGSKTKADLLAFKPGQALVVQCKWSGSGTASLPGPDERREIVRLAHLIGATPLVARNVKRRMTFQQITDDGTDPKAVAPFHLDLPKETNHG